MISYLTSHKGSFSDIKRCIRSIQADHIKSGIRYEHLVWVDGVASNSEEIDQYKELEKGSGDNLYFIVSSENKGKSHAMNSLIEVANGKIISFIDSDDWVLPGRSSETNRYISEFEQTCVGSWYYTGDRALKTIELAEYPLTSSEIRAYFLFFPYILFSSLSIRSDILQKDEQLRFDETIRAGLDYEFYSKLLGRVEVSNIPKPLVFYTKNPNGITRDRVSRQMQLNTHARVAKTILSTYIKDHEVLTSLVNILMLSVSEDYVPCSQFGTCNARTLLNTLEYELAKSADRPNSPPLMTLQTEAEKNIFYCEIKRRVEVIINAI